MGKGPRSNDPRRDLRDLQSQYDKERGGYNVPTGSGRGRTTQFYASSYTPEQGGYYADESILGPRGGGNQRNPLYYDLNRATSISEYYTKDRQETSARKPNTRVNPSLVASRRLKRKQRAIAGGRQGTILTGDTLGGGTDERTRRRTLLG